MLVVVDVAASSCFSVYYAYPLLLRLPTLTTPNHSYYLGLPQVVGDPGMGKSHMLTAIAALAPRGVYVSGTSSTATGLTVVRRLHFSLSHLRTVDCGTVVLRWRARVFIFSFQRKVWHRSAHAVRFYHGHN